MLTRDLVRATVRGRDLRPSWIKTDKPALREAAEDLLTLWDHATEARWRRREVDAAISEWIGDRRDHKILRGLAKLALDHSTFEQRSPLPPVELRDRVFRAARQAGPLALEPGPLGRTTAEDVLAAVAAELDCEPEEVREALYADLREEERLITHKLGDVDWLLCRYNVALVQALLLHAVELQLTLTRASTPRLRQLMRLAKFHQLMVHAERDGDQIELTFDGPASLLARSTRYGLELASFFPAILLQDGAWSLRATVLWTRARHRKDLIIDSDRGLVSHRADTGAYQTQEQLAFAERFAARDTDWTLESGSDVLPLGDKAVLVPDFCLIAPDGRRAYLEIVGFWRPEALQARLERLERYGPGTVIVAVSRRRRAAKGKELPRFDGPLIPFAEVVPVAKVLDAAQAIAR